MTQDYSDYSSNCNFTKQTPKTYTKTTTGLLLQGEDLIIRQTDPTTGDTVTTVDQETPLLIQSNNIIEIEKGGSVTQIKPTDQYVDEYIINSWMTEADLDNLELKNTVSANIPVRSVTKSH